MELIEFSNKIRDCVSAYLGEEYTAQVKEITKNNGVPFVGLVIGKKDSRISPTIYMEPFYEEYQNGTTMGKLVREVCACYEKNRVEEGIDMNFFLEYESVRGRIFQKVINYEQNEKMLADVPHLRFLDLAVVCYYAYMNDYLGNGSIQVSTGHLDHWGISQEELFADAARNTKEKLGMELKGMDEIIWELMAEHAKGADAAEILKEMPKEKGAMPMYVMSLRGHYFGAVCICHEEWLEEFGRKRGNFYILPSSIHELILVPDKGKEKTKTLQNMVREVNESHVLLEEQLSNNVYYYDYLNKSVKIV